MAKCDLLAFLLCEDATKARDGKVTLHRLFDRIISPRNPREVKLFYVFYKVFVKESCTIALRVVDPSGQEIPGSWRDSLSEIGPIQTIWALTSAHFKQSGTYVLELRQEAADVEPLSLASMTLVVDQQGD
jgi:hypothetical protein